MSQIPRPELDPLILPCAGATDLALEGEVGDGYQALLAGLAEARQAEAQELVARWERAVEKYAGRWGVGRA